MDNYPLAVEFEGKGEKSHTSIEETDAQSFRENEKSIIEQVFLSYDTTE